MVCYFWEQASPVTGLVKDRCNARQATTDSAVVASIAATGFGLTALCIGEKREFISLTEARNRVLNTLRFLWKTLPDHRGFFYHFANVNTGERIWDSEISSVDTAILLCGILCCRQHLRILKFASCAVTSSIALIGPGCPKIQPCCLMVGCRKPAFFPTRWDYYSELMMMYLLGNGICRASARKPEAWDAWKRNHF